MRRHLDALLRRTGLAFPRRKLAWTGHGYRNRVGDARPAGVNLIGLPRAELGIGAHLRGVAAALDATETPYSVFDYGKTRHRQEDDRLAAKLDPRCPYRVNLFCLNADGVLDLWTQNRRLFAGRYNVGYGWWELDDYPEPWLWSMNVLDEVWAPSRHVQETLSRKAAVPVVRMPLAVDFPPPEPLPRAELGAALEAVLFGFTFDFSSQVERKNPLGVVEAFRRAFPPERRDVALVLKSKTVESDPRQVRARETVHAAVAADPRIRLVDAVWDAGRVHALLATLDVYVSLHRAEGFGLGMAEAMLLAKPVVATEWSGNLDFTRPDAALLVPYRLVPVLKGAYLDLEGASHWAEPDVDAAAVHLRQLADDPALRRRLGERGREVIATEHSPAVVGARYVERLRLLGLL